MTAIGRSHPGMKIYFQSRFNAFVYQISCFRQLDKATAHPGKPFHQLDLGLRQLSSANAKPDRDQELLGLSIEEFSSID